MTDANGKTPTLGELDAKMTNACFDCPQCGEGGTYMDGDHLAEDMPRVLAITVGYHCKPCDVHWDVTYSVTETQVVARGNEKI